jgi:hypothetical protein
MAKREAKNQKATDGLEWTQMKICEVEFSLPASVFICVHLWLNTGIVISEKEPKKSRRPVKSGG